MTHTLEPHPAILLIDVGNTRLKAGWVLRANGRRETSGIALDHTDSEQLLAWLSRQPIRPVAAMGVNVAGEHVARSLNELLLQQHALRINWVDSQPISAGVRNDYALPSQLGPDRWMAMLGLAGQQDDSNTAMMLASFGTATTIDTLVRCSHVGEAATGADHKHPAPGWRFVGGLILPGVELMRRSLNTGTARLPAAQGSVVAFPDGTQCAISSGIAAAQAGAVLRQWLAVRDRFQAPPRVFSAGGAWTALETEVQSLLATIQSGLGLPASPIRWLASPVLDGLAHLARKDHTSP